MVLLIHVLYVKMSKFPGSCISFLTPSYLVRPGAFAFTFLFITLLEFKVLLVCVTYLQFYFSYFQQV